jgi:heme/copper-type cytochrome/quinol oxidase subunit 2
LGASGWLAIANYSQYQGRRCVARDPRATGDEREGKAMTEADEAKRWTKGLIAAAVALLLAGSLSPVTARAEPPQLVLQNHRFVPDRITVPAGQRFSILVTNRDDTPDEFESAALRVEKIVMPGHTITVFGGPLAAGSYEFYDDYHRDTAKGVVEAR